MKQRTKYERSLDRIELIITYQCNRKCYNCEALVRQAPSNECMQVEQIQKFIEESVENKIKWKNIRVLGGEPTLHKDIDKIIELLVNYKNKYSPNTNIAIISNGTGAYVNTVLKELAEKYAIDVQNSNKISDVQPQFSPINQAPIDVEEYKNMDFSKGCWITTVCGIALDMYGYYPCSAAAAAARVFGYDVGRKHMPSKSDTMDDLFPKFCRICGHHYNKINEISNLEVANNDNVEELEKTIELNQKRIENQTSLDYEVISKTWKQVLLNYKKQPLILNKY